MATWTKGFVQTSNRDPFEIVEIIDAYLAMVMSEDVPLFLKNRGVKEVPAKMRAKYEFAVFGRFFTAYFTDGKDPRQLSVFFFNQDTDDYDHILKGPKVSFMLGDHGNAPAIIRGILERCKHLGECWMVDSDLMDDAEWKKV